MFDFDMEPIINSHTLKVEKENAYAMISGFEKNGKQYHISIYTADKEAQSLKNNFRKRPKLLTIFKGPPREAFPLSCIGKELRVDNWELKAKYLAVLDRIFHIHNCLEIWEVLCHNGIFDIWEPEAPFRRLGGRESDRDPMILLLRIFKIKEDLSDKIEAKVDYYHTVQSQIVHIIQPIVPNKYFTGIIDEIRLSARRFLIREEPINYTTTLRENTV